MRDYRQRYVFIGVLIFMVMSSWLAALGQEEITREDRIRDLEKRIEKMEEEKTAILKMLEEISMEESTPDKGEKDLWYNRLSLGGYGESHFNFLEGKGNDFSDLHRFVLYLGYDFADWIKLHSETEIEHAFVADGNGEISIEQLYVDFLVSPYANIRVGRVLTPLGIINSKHEPTTFNGVERPSFARYIIPSTWSSDGIGLFGNLGSSLSYEMYLASGLNGAMFDARNGIRNGRMKERPGISDPAFSFRVDYSPLANLDSLSDQDLRLGASFWSGGLNNGNKGINPNLDADMKIYSIDAEYSYSDFDFRGAAALEKINGAPDIGNNTAREIRGYYLEAAWHLWPQEFRKGRLKDSDAVLFVRYDDFDTQYRMPLELDKDLSADRTELTVGLSFFPVSNLVFKIDYQIPDDSTDSDLADKFNLGLGWHF
jgi:hypothetical protein